jgi:ABC-type amino acid transport substrate-binding protein
MTTRDDIWIPRTLRCRRVSDAVLAMSALAQEQASEIRAATIIAPPFVIEQDDRLTGFSIDLWDATRNGLRISVGQSAAQGGR